MTTLTEADLTALADEAGVTRLQVERMERAGFLVERRYEPGPGIQSPQFWLTYGDTPLNPAWAQAMTDAASR